MVLNFYYYFYIYIFLLSEQLSFSWMTTVSVCLLLTLPPLLCLPPGFRLDPLRGTTVAPIPTPDTGTGRPAPCTPDGHGQTQPQRSTGHGPHLAGNTAHLVTAQVRSGHARPGQARLPFEVLVFVVFLF